MSEQKPEAVWVFPEEKKRRGGRTALIIAIVVVVLLIAAGVALFLIPRGSGNPAPTVSPSASATPTASSVPSPVPPTSATPTNPPTSAPPQPDPSIAQFRDQVGFRLDTASEGLDMIGQGASDSAQTVTKLEGDAQRLSDTPPPSSIAPNWRSTLQQYTSYLDALAKDASDAGALSGARDAVADLKRLIGA